MWLPTARQRKTPRSEFVVFSRASCITALSIESPPHETDIKSLFKIGKGKSWDKRKMFAILLGNLENTIKYCYVDSIRRIDTVVTKNIQVGVLFS